MRVAILISGMVVSLGSAALASPLAPLPLVSTTIQVHGCHHYYAQDLAVGTVTTRIVGCFGARLGARAEAKKKAKTTQAFIGSIERIGRNNREPASDRRAVVMSAFGPKRTFR
jgi:hypothetical protein